MGQYSNLIPKVKHDIAVSENDEKMLYASGQTDAANRIQLE